MITLKERTIQIKKGFNINLAGSAEEKINDTIDTRTFSIKPTDFTGLEMPKLLVNVGDEVKAGDPIFYNRKSEDVKFTNPVSGEIITIERGERRKILRITTLADKKIKHKEFQKYNVSEVKNLSKDIIKKAILESGIWPQIIQRPYGIIANAQNTPRDIFISGFDSSPLAPNYDFIFKNNEKFLQVGIDILKKLTNGTIYICIDEQKEYSKLFGHLENVEIFKIRGCHPAGNVGTQIHNINPIKKEDIVWTINPYGVIQIGKLFLLGIYDASKTIAFCGSEVKKPQYYSTYMGASIEPFLKNNTNSDDIRIISGNVLTGKKITMKDSIGYYDHQITVIPEAKDSRFFLTKGWLAPISKRLSFHRAIGILSFLRSNHKYRLDTSSNGDARAFIMTGHFEKVLPMDILPTQLLKSIITEDYEAMESLGIYEVIEEDLALCEFIDPSKNNIQALLRKGLNMMNED